MSPESRPAALAPVANVTRREVVLDALRHALLSGELRPGDRVKEAPMADLLGVSRPTVRDAVSQLVHEGSFVSEPYKGITVAELTAEEMLDLAEVRVSLETLAAQTVAADPGGAGMRMFRAALDTHLAAIDDGDVVDADLTHLALHRTLWEASGNATLTRIWPLLESKTRIAMSIDQATRANLPRDRDLHLRLAEVIETGDDAAIAGEVREHIAGSAGEIAALLAPSDD